MAWTFTVYGTPQPAGSKRALGFRRPDGSVGARVVDANNKAAMWKQAVAAAVTLELLEGRICAFDGPVPVRVVCTFFVTRPADHYKKDGTLKPSAPQYPCKRPDATKLWRGTEDAITGLIWKDDAQIVEQIIRKRFSPTSAPYTTIEFEPMP